MGNNRADLNIDRKQRAYIAMQPVNKQSPEERLQHFEEIYIGYEPEAAIAEAARCIQCPDPAPCQIACPMDNDIPTALRLVEEGDFDAAAKVFHRTSPLPEICSRVCPQENLCEGSCTHGGGVAESPIRIGKIEKFVIDYDYAKNGPLKDKVKEATGKKVAVVGGGPAGMAAGQWLRREGHAVTIYDANPYPGGLMLYGIPAFKLEKARVMDKVSQLQDMGIDFIQNTRIGVDIPLQQLADEYDAVFLGIGANKEPRSRWEGSDLEGVYGANEFLIRANVPCEYQPNDYQLINGGCPPAVGKRVFVIGGGDTAMDCVRTALRLQMAYGFEQQDVTCAYRRTEAEMPGSKAERVNAREEGAKFEWLTAPKRFIGDEDGNLTGVEFVRMRLGAPDESGRRSPETIEGSEYIEAADTVALALGYWPDDLLGEQIEALETHNWGLISIDEETGKTSMDNVWAGGDGVTGPDLVSTAARAGKKAAYNIHMYLSGK